MSFSDRIAECSVFDAARYVPLMVDSVEVGLVERGFAERLRTFPEVFQVGETEVRLHPSLDGFETRTAAVDAALRELNREGCFLAWRDELIPVGTGFAVPPAFAIERGAAARFGVRGYGVHLNGYLRDGKDLRMWVARRSRQKAMAPGKLDQIVAGGQPFGLGLRENLVKECGEEAAIPPELVAHAAGAGAISYCTERAEGLRRDVEFIYDLELPADFTPVPVDGEVEAFELWPVERVAETVRDSDAFKFNCSLVVIDFLIRHGLIEPDHPEYQDLVHGLRHLR